MMNYDPSVFTRVTSLDAAKRIILTDEASLTTDQRWEKETPHICDLIEQNVALSETSVVLDYGCGVGRIAKELINRHGCFVFGVDISPNMRALAASYVASDRFIACHPVALDGFLVSDVSLVLSIWVFQHVENLSMEFNRIKNMMRSDGSLFVVNEADNRFVPTNKGWASDGIDVRAELRRTFKIAAEGNLDHRVVGDAQSQRTFWACYGKR